MKIRDVSLTWIALLISCSNPPTPENSSVERECASFAEKVRVFAGESEERNSYIENLRMDINANGELVYLQKSEDAFQIQCGTEFFDIGELSDSELMLLLGE